ncbi:unnamed protein product [Meganyctiphanes norvegica]|uniref:Uncharacterized protein n=1 Tax=Meganyctiphanes norvegica TaxID=48144 RepID=A0AAV2RED1_MEGNR
MFEKCPPRIYSNATLNDYEPFTDIERCVHIQDVLDFNKHSLSTSRISRKDKSHLENKGFDVLWFGISSTQSSHHVYGNISFVIRLQTLLDKFRSSRKLYYLETVERFDSVMSRLIFTSRSINELGPANMLDMRRVGYPLFQDSCGTYYHLKSIPGYRHGHNIEILIDMPRTRPSDAKWLFDSCRKIPVNHQHANFLNFQTGKYRVCICYKYNNRQKECPFPFSEEQTCSHMKRECPAFLDSTMNSRDNERPSSYVSHRHFSSHTTSNIRKVLQTSESKQQPDTRNDNESARSSISGIHGNSSSQTTNNIRIVTQASNSKYKPTKQNTIESARSSISGIHGNSSSQTTDNIRIVTQAFSSKCKPTQPNAIESARSSRSGIHGNSSSQTTNNTRKSVELPEFKHQPEEQNVIESSRSSIHGTFGNSSLQNTTSTRNEVQVSEFKHQSAKLESTRSSIYGPHGNSTSRNTISPGRTSQLAEFRYNPTQQYGAIHSNSTSHISISPGRTTLASEFRYQQVQRNDVESARVPSYQPAQQHNLKRLFFVFMLGLIFILALVVFIYFIANL